VAVASRCDGRDHRNHLRSRQQIEQCAVHLHRFADEAQIEDALDIAVGIGHRLAGFFGEHHVAVLAAQPDRPFARRVDHRDDFLVDRTCENHLDDLDRGAVRHPQSALEFRFDAHLFEHRADLRPAAMNDDRIDAGLLQKRDILREGLSERGVAHGVAAIFHHDGLVFVALHIGQRPCKNVGFALGGLGFVFVAHEIHGPAVT
jgi:hypothetical protein